MEEYPDHVFISAALVCRGKGTVTLGNFPCNLSRNLVAPLRYQLHESLPSVTCPETNITARNVFVAVTVARSRSNFLLLATVAVTKNIARHVHLRPCYTRQRFVQLVLQQNCETSFKKNCLLYKSA